MAKPKSSDVLSAFVRSLERTARLGEEVDKLEAQVATREADALKRVLEHLRPVVRFVDGPLLIREPWVDEGAPRRDTDDHYREPGLVLVHSFKQERAPNQIRVDYVGRKIVYTRSGRLIELRRTGRWLEGGDRKDSFWNCEVLDVEITPDFARENLKPAIRAIVGALRTAGDGAEERRASLRDRLRTLEEVDRLLE